MMTIVMIMMMMMTVGAINGQVFKIVRKRGAKKAELTFTLGMYHHHTQHHTTPNTHSKHRTQYTITHHTTSPYTAEYIAWFYTTHTM